MHKITICNHIYLCAARFGIFVFLLLSLYYEVSCFLRDWYLPHPWVVYLCWLPIKTLKSLFFLVTGFWVSILESCQVTVMPFTKGGDWKWGKERGQDHMGQSGNGGEDCCGFGAVWLIAQNLLSDWPWGYLYSKERNQKRILVVDSNILVTGCTIFLSAWVCRERCTIVAAKHQFCPCWLHYWAVLLQT